MGNKKIIPLDRTGTNYERETQGQMFDEVQLKTWAILYLEGKSQTLNEFTSNIQKTIKMAAV